MGKINKIIIFIIVILIAAETACRIKFFFMHDKEWNYITAPFLVHPWNTSCKNRKVYSPRHKKPIDITYDANYFRGDRINPEKKLSEFRIFVLGDSSVDSPQPDEEIWTEQMKSYLPAIYNNKELRVVNAGRPGLASKGIKNLYNNKVRLFSPDLTLYYAAVNENIDFIPYTVVDRSIQQIKNKIHDLLHYNSMLYTYLREKINFLLAKNRKDFWIINLPELRNNFLGLNAECLKSGSKFIFITQAMNFPRFYKGADTFNYKEVLNLLSSLRYDAAYKYDNEEIRMLNQRLAVFYSIELCEKYNIPYISLLNEVEKLGDIKRGEMFSDFIHQTYIGDSVLGELIGKKINNLLMQSEGKEGTSGRI